MVPDSNSEHQLLLLPTDWCLAIFASRTTQAGADIVASCPANTTSCARTVYGKAATQCCSQHPVFIESRRPGEPAAAALSLPEGEVCVTGVGCFNKAGMG